MKYIFVLFFLLLLSCGGSSQSSERYVRADLCTYTFTQHQGKIVKSITYHPQLHSSAGYCIRIAFTDNSHIDIWSYKYIPHIY